MKRNACMWVGKDGYIHLFPTAEIFHSKNYRNQVFHWDILLKCSKCGYVEPVAEDESVINTELFINNFFCPSCFKKSKLTSKMEIVYIECSEDQNVEDWDGETYLEHKVYGEMLDEIASSTKNSLLRYRAFCAPDMSECKNNILKNKCR